MRKRKIEIRCSPRKERHGDAKMGASLFDLSQKKRSGHIDSAFQTVGGLSC